ncbi:hypothetical protein RZS28_18130 [Methylocapsa polymorpha]|uniref:Uncharacterized protein n=1 Tax=Methylocapsa polymorpha TaxID=3080828 RepID=A0ABZ0HTF0_9HYPH|nr:hypothetical protein RZS28_18130 [Methylocapsa sp. RX1]
MAPSKNPINRLRHIIEEAALIDSHPETLWRIVRQQFAGLVAAVRATIASKET